MRRGRPSLRWDHCVKTDLTGVEGEWRMRTRDGGVETVGGDNSEMMSISSKRWRHTISRFMAHHVEPLLRYDVRLYQASLFTRPYALDSLMNSVVVCCSHR